MGNQYYQKGKATVAMLENRDFTVMIDQSGSMNDPGTKPGISRWKEAEETTKGIAHAAAEYDKDGLTLYTFNNNFKRHENVTPQKVGDVWKEQRPNGGTDLARVLKDGLDNFFKRKANGTLKENGELITVVTDGTPDNKDEVKRVIIEATKKMDKDEELGILFLQIGNDAGATQFLKELDDDLGKDGAKFDIVDTKTCEEVGNMSLTDVFLGALND